MCNLLNRIANVQSLSTVERLKCNLEVHRTVMICANVSLRMRAYVLREYTKYMQWHYIRPYIYPCTAPYLGQNEFFSFSKARFSKRLERFGSTLLLYTATMVQTSRMPRFSFWNECYRFAPNSNFHSARIDWEMDERVELSRRKYSRWRVCSHNLASLVAKV